MCTVVVEKYNYDKLFVLTYSYYWMTIFFSFSQLIYNFTDGGASFRFISCDPTKLSEQGKTIEQKPIKDREITMTELKAIGVKLPNAL